MMKAKTELQEKARELRATMSVGEISEQLGVSKSSVSLWVRDVEVSPEAKKAIRERGRRKCQISYQKTVEERKEVQELRKWHSPGSSKDVGDMTEAVILAEFVRHGVPVLKPWGDNRRYDYVIETESGRFLRIQCKTARIMKHGSVNFSTSSSYTHRGRKSRNYRGDVDLFAVYCPKLNRCFLIPVPVCSLTSQNLNPSRRLATGLFCDDFDFGPIVSFLTHDN